MNKITSIILFITTLALCLKCKQIDVSKSTGKAIYNQAYQENFEKDNITDIKSKANNAYIIIDPFENAAVAASVKDLQKNGNEVGAYISIGTGETFRDDYNDIKPYLVSRQWGQWPDEFFIYTTTTGVIDIMKARIDKIDAWGCDWVEFDNMDWCFDDDLRKEYGFKVSQEEGMSYYQELCDYVHIKGMKCMAKNTVKGASSFDGVLYESYNDDENWWNENGAQDFLNANKLVIINHYNERKCDKTYSKYMKLYNTNISFICEDCKKKKYVHYND